MNNSPTATNGSSFLEKYQHCLTKHQSMLCIGLDPDPRKFPNVISGAGAIFAFCRSIVDATADLACAFKPQIAYFAAIRAEEQLEQIIHYIHDQYPHIPVILDAKRGDIGATATQYAVEAFERYQADAVTVNPYMGFDSMQPYLEYAGRGVIVLCRTSNLGGSDLQSLKTTNDQGQSQHIYEVVAQKAATIWNTNGQMGLVVGATFPEEIARVRSLVGDMPLLIPGIGAQGGDIDATVKAGQGKNLLINSSRAILYAGQGGDFEKAARQVALQTRDAINLARKMVI